MNTPAILTKNLWHIYPGSIEALKGVDLTIREGEFVALIGPNGSGKTTLAKHFNGLLKPTKGAVQIFGEDSVSAGASKLSAVVGYVFQNPDHMLFANTIEEEVAYGPKNLKLPDHEVEERVDDALKAVGLLGIRKESPFFFGRGMRRMITLAAVLSMNPKILVIDEPTTGLDYLGSIEVMALLQALHEQGRTILIITHDMKLVVNYTSHTIIMQKGRIPYDGPTDNAFLSSDLLERYGLRAPQTFRLAQKLELNIRPSVTPNELAEILELRLGGKIH
jgi:energy-coupling factor transporter ATP-binding protein EcfA2